MNVEELYKQHKNLVYNLSLNYLQNIEDAEELTQDVFVSAYQHLDSFKAEAKASTWLYRITINKCLDFLKAKKRQKRFAFISSIFKDNSTELRVDPAHFIHPGAQLEHQEALARIFKYLNELPENQRTAIILNKIDGLSQSEAAEIMNLNVKAFESLMVRAKTALKNKLEE